MGNIASTAGLSSLALAVSIACLPINQAFSQQPRDDRQSSARSGQLEELVVTAQRRETLLQSTPVAVTALSAEGLETRQVRNTLQLQNFVPNLQTQPGNSSPTTLTIGLRGVGEQSGGIATTESPVGVYLDDVFQGRLSGTNVQFSDIERVEVLRGPQGTLFGRNAQAGTLNIISRVPDDEFYGSASLGLGNYERVLARAALGGPVVADTLSASAALVFLDQGKGTKVNPTRGTREDKEDSFGARVKLRYQGIDRLDAILTFRHNRDRNDGLVLAPIDAQTVTPILGTDWSTRQPIESFGAVDSTAVSLDLRLDLGFAELRSITAWQEVDDAWRFDLSGGAVRPGDVIAAALDRTSKIDQDQWTQEIRLSGLALSDRLNWITGLFYYTESAEQTVNDVLTFPAGFSVTPPVRNYTTDNESWAFFAQGTYQLTDALSLTAGLRYTTEDKEIVGTFDAPFADETSYSAWTPRLGLEYQVNEESFLYLSAARGFRAGGYSGFAGSAQSISTPYEPETVWSYELGGKFDLYERRLRLNLAAFFAQYKSLQAQILITTDEVAALPVIQNAFDLDVWGIELESEAILAPGVSLYLTLGVQEVDIKNADPTSDFVTFTPPPSRPLQTPLYTGAIGLNVNRPLSNLFRDAPGSMLFGVDFIFRDRVFSNNNNSIWTENRPQRRINGFVGWESDDARWRATLSAQNLTNRADWVGGFYIPNIFGADQASRNVLPPRMWMAEVSYRY